MREKLLKGEDLKDVPLMSVTNTMPWSSLFEATLSSVKPPASSAGNRPSPLSSPKRQDTSASRLDHSVRGTAGSMRSGGDDGSDDDDLGDSQSPSNSLVAAMRCLPRRPGKVPGLVLGETIVGEVSLGQWLFYQVTLPDVQPPALLTIDCSLKSDGGLSLFVSSKQLPTALEHEWRSGQVHIAAVSHPFFLMVSLMNDWLLAESSLLVFVCPPADDCVVARGMPLLRVAPSFCLPNQMLGTELARCSV